MRIDRQNRSAGAGSARAEKKQKNKKAMIRNRTGDMSPVRPDHLRCRIATWMAVCDHTHDVVIQRASRMEHVM